MTTYPVARRSSDRFVPRPDEARWPGLATPAARPRARRASREALFRRAVRAAAGARRASPDGAVHRRAAARTPR